MLKRYCVQAVQSATLQCPVSVMSICGSRTGPNISYEICLAAMFQMHE